MKIVDNLIVAFIATYLLSCGGGKKTSPSNELPTVTFAFRLHDFPPNEEFRIRTSSQDFIKTARAQLSLPEPQRLMFPIGPIADGNAGYNLKWSWHFTKAEFAEISIELCDGTPSMVEEDRQYWLNTVKSFCPWSGYVYAEVE